MTRPDDIPQRVWDAAERVGEAIYGRHERGWGLWPLFCEAGGSAQEHIARAILSAEQREREACAVLMDEQEQAPGNTDMQWQARICAQIIRNRGTDND